MTAPRRPQVRQRDLTRALKGAAAAGVAVSRIEIDKDGKIIILTKAAEASSADELLDKWLEQNAPAS